MERLDSSAAPSSESDPAAGVLSVFDRCPRERRDGFGMETGYGKVVSTGERRVPGYKTIKKLLGAREYDK